MLKDIFSIYTILRMSLIISTKKPKCNKTSDLVQYQRDYRETHAEHLRNLDKVNYYKRKYNLDKEFIALFGEFSGDAFKIIKEFNELTKKHPELAPHIISMLTAEPKATDE